MRPPDPDKGLHNVVGGPLETDRNVISGNKDGMLVTGSSSSHNKIVGNFIGLLKDTTLVSIIGLFDILNIIQSAISRDVPWRGLHKEPLFVGALIFFVLCFAMSKYSQHLERKLSTEHR